MNRNKNYSDLVENATAGLADHEEFFAALVLLHSTDVDSAEKLRQMLDSMIARKCGPKKTLGARMALCDSSSKEDRGGDADLRNDRLNGAVNFNKENVSIVVTQFYQNNENFVIAVDCKTEIPTISIPDDQGSCNAGDCALCKVCNGGRLGPLILLECQECQDVYHPLCHQPPVLDIDIYDPRLVWHCAKCVELSETAAITVETPEIDDNNFQTREKKTIDCYSDKEPPEQPNYFHRRTRIRSSNIQRAGVTAERIDRFAATSLRNCEPGLSFPNSFSAASSSVLQLRKRVGSKLTMTRGTTK